MRSCKDGTESDCEYMRQRLCIVCVVLIAALVGVPVFAADGSIEKSGFVFPMPAGSFGFSYPLIASFSGGGLIPLGNSDKDDLAPSVPSLRADIVVGIGGGSVDAGIYFPFGQGSFALNLKKSRMRTWLVSWKEPLDRTYDGVVVELVALGHIPGKIGLGYFKDRELIANQRNTFTYFFFGVGW